MPPCRGQMAVLELIRHMRSGVSGGAAAQSPPLVWFPLVVATQRHIQAFDKSQASPRLHTHKPKKKEKSREGEAVFC